MIHGQYIAAEAILGQFRRGRFDRPTTGHRYPAGGPVNLCSNYLQTSVIAWW